VRSLPYALPDIPVNYHTQTQQARAGCDSPRPLDGSRCCGLQGRYPNRPDRLPATGVATGVVTLSSRDRLPAAGVAILGAEAPAAEAAFFGCRCARNRCCVCGTDMPATDVAHYSCFAFCGTDVPATDVASVGTNL